MAINAGAVTDDEQAAEEARRRALRAELSGESAWEPDDRSVVRGPAGEAPPTPVALTTDPSIAPGESKPGWPHTPDLEPSAAPNEPGVSSAPMTAQTSASMTMTPSTGPPLVPVPTNPFRSSLNAALEQRLRQLMSPDQGANDPTLRPAIDAYNLQSDRGLEDERARLAEENYAKGTLNTGGASTQNQRAMENAAGKKATFVGTAVQQQSIQRAQQLQDLLTLGGSLISEQDRLAAEKELAQLDADLRQQGIDYNYEQLGSTVGFNYAQLAYQKDRDAMRAALGLE